ncbi:MAG: hypothetical protein LKG11_04930 [Bacilli bacterium]|nr:hypothetical protein [Bacilli bacterium]
MENQEKSEAAKFVGLRSLDTTSLAKLPTIDVLITKSSRTDRRTKTVNDNYSADVIFDFITKYHIVLTGNQYGLLVTIQNGKFVPEQFRAKAKVRITKFVWGQNDQGKERSSYMVELYFDRLLILSYRLQPSDPFVQLLLLRLSKGLIGKEYAPIPFDGTAADDSFDESLKAESDSPVGPAV